MSIDTAAILAAKYKDNPVPLQEAVLGRGENNINAYAALRALQLQKEAQQFQMAQAAMQGQQYQNQPSMVEQAVAPPMPQQMPQGQPQMPPQQAPQAPQGGQGLAGMPMPEQSFAPGGIVAFADGSLVEEDDRLGSIMSQLEEKENSPGDPATYAKMSALFPALMRQVASQQYTPMRDEDFKTAFESRRALLEDKAGPSPFDQFQEKLAALDAGREEKVKQGRGLALLQAIPEILAPGGLERGLARGAGKFGSAYEKVLEADKAEQRALMSMDFNLADAKRKEAMGLNKEALTAADQARADHNAAQRFKLDKVSKLASLATSGARATKPTGNTEPKNFDALAAKYVTADLFKNNQLPEGKRLPKELVEERAYARAAKDWSRVPAGDIVDIKRQGINVQQRQADTAETRAETEQQRLTTEQGKQVNEAITKWERSREGIEARNKGDKAYQAAKAAKEKEIRARFGSAPSGNKNSTPAPTGGKVVTKAQLEATAKAYNKTYEEAVKAAEAKGYTVKE